MPAPDQKSSNQRLYKHIYDQHAQITNLLYQELIFVGVEAASWQEVLTLLANQLYQSGYVRESYLQAVLDRERQFPTGLRTAEVAVALPHTEKEH
ncbi:MAG TPA: PTS sugar transporter subunit IIA, partial [Anaerolineaceae bacterium]|nr:PTS sugar transporter subunit IIA [Anaerolineaceae bacterium]